MGSIIKNKAWLVIAVCAVVVVGAAVAATMFEKPVVVNNFDTCIEAGGARMESYPEQCLYDGKTYMNEEQWSSAPPEEVVSGAEYIGMTEDDALGKAEKSSTPARVVERDGEPLPVTMDFMPGRLNFYIKDGTVQRAEVEGQGMDTPERIE